jgi:hypothetical protein
MIMVGNIKKLTIVLLLLNGIGALFGGYNLIAHPDGSSFHMPLSILKHSPFHNFLIPGIILFTVNGLSSLLVLLTILLKLKNNTLFITAQGAILTGWIVIQIIMLNGIHYLHLIFGGFGLALIVFGLIARKYQINQNQKIAT